MARAQTLPRWRALLKRLNAFKRGARRIDSMDARALHLTRVASRRLRELLPVLGLPAGAAQKLNRQLKKTTKQLGVVRELDVLTHMLRELEQDPRYLSSALQYVSEAVNTDRAAEQDRLASRLPSRKLQRLARRLRRVAEQNEPRLQGHSHNTPLSARAWVWAIDARTSRRAADLHAAIEIAGSVYAPERLHDVRIAVKRLRYAAELRAEARRQRSNRDLTALKTAQDLLGRLHDVEMLIARAQRTQASLSPATLTAWRELDALVDTLEDDCRVLHARYMRTRSTLTAIANRIRSGTKAVTLVRRRAVS